MASIFLGGKMEEYGDIFDDTKMFITLGEVMNEDFCLNTNVINFIDCFYQNQHSDRQNIGIISTIPKWQTDLVKFTNKPIFLCEQIFISKDYKVNNLSMKRLSPDDYVMEIIWFNRSDSVNSDCFKNIDISTLQKFKIFIDITISKPHQTRQNDVDLINNWEKIVINNSGFSHEVITNISFSAMTHFYSNHYYELIIKPYMEKYGSFPD